MKKATFLLIVTLLAGACNKMSFAPTSAVNQKLDDPAVADPIPPVELPQRKTGACVDQQNLASCLKCELPASPAPPPVISTKAQKLARIMAMSCQIYNKSYPKDYVAPSASEIEAHVLACTPSLYPETVMSPSQVRTMGRLLDESDPSLRLKLFKGLWYQPPFSDDFELYFGLEGGEAASVFCLNKGSLSGFLYTSEYAKAQGAEGGMDTWSRDPAAQARWQAAQLQRQQLLSCLDKPGASSFSPAPIPAPSKSCIFRSFVGKFEQGGREEIQNALVEGYRLAIETDNACLQIAQIPSAADFHGKLKIVGYKCH